MSEIVDAKNVATLLAEEVTNKQRGSDSGIHHEDDDDDNYHMAMKAMALDFSIAEASGAFEYTRLTVKGFTPFVCWSRVFLLKHRIWRPLLPQHVVSRRVQDIAAVNGLASRTVYTSWFPTTASSRLSSFAFGSSSSCLDPFVPTTS